MKKKFKRSDIKLQLEDFIKELDRELIMRRAVYAKQVQQKKLSEFRANKRYLIILELKELLELADRRKIKFKELRQIVEELQVKNAPKQSSIQFPN